MITNPITFEKWLCRCSCISRMMSNARGSEPLTDKQWITVRKLEAKIDNGKATEKQRIEYTRLLQKDKDSEKIVLGDACVQYLLEAYAWETEQMCSITKEMDVEYFDRGRKTELESVELLSFVDDIPYVKNETRFENKFLSGIPDILKISDDFKAKAIRDIKSTNDYPTFLYKIHKGTDTANEFQLKGYGDILNCNDLSVVFTLPTMPQSIREGYKMKLAYKMDEVTTESPRFLKAWAELEHSMIFDSIPPHKRVYKIPVNPFSEQDKQRVYDRVKIAREWLNSFHERFKSLNS